MKIIKSGILGYCQGVAKTLELADFCIEKGQSEDKPFYSIGALIHNSDVVEEYQNKGLKIIKTPDSEAGIALIRAHGISDYLRSEFEKKGFELIDATCSLICHTKQVMKQANLEKRKVVVLGVKGHAETNCLLGSENIDAFLVSDQDDLSNLFSSVNRQTKITLVTQTTFSQKKYEDYCSQICSYYKDCVVGTKLCPDCNRRKEEGLALSSKCDAVVVIGGKNSENTKDLVSFLQSTGKPVFHIERAQDLDRSLVLTLKNYDIVGVCSGTSTSMQAIDAVCDALEREK